ncbi:MAG: ABC transporter permease [Desulfurococcales archaeon]|nr:ABC transporter permease [Desulfurococcales archaeon]
MLNLFKAELYSIMAWYRSNRVMLVLSFLWPYATVLVLLALGSSYGSLEEWRRSMGVEYPLIYLFAASAVAFASAGIIESASGVALWHRWVGTLPYVYLAPAGFPRYLLASGVANSLVMALIDFTAVAPAVVLLGGLEGGVRLLLVLLVMVIGSLPLVGIAILASLASLMAREEGNIIYFVNPLLLLASGIFYPLEVLPRLLRLASEVLPVTYVVEAARIASTYTTGLGRAVLGVAYTLAVMTVIYNMVSLYLIGSGERGVRRRGVI